jgi:hypothetical protein
VTFIEIQDNYLLGRDLFCQGHQERLDGFFFAATCSGSRFGLSACERL